MSIASEISRISKNVSDSLDAVALKGVTVPTGSTSDNLPNLIAQITGGSGGEYTRTVVFPTQTANCNTNLMNNAYYTILQFSTNLDTSAQYIVTFDNTEYLCDGYQPESNSPGVGDFRVTQTTGAQYLNYPFFIDGEPATGTYYFVVRGSGTHTLKIEEIEFVTNGTTLVNKTITQNGTYDPADDNADGYSSVTVDVSGGSSSWSELANQNVTIVSGDPNYFLINDYTTPFAANQTYRVTWGNGGTQYICQTDVDGAGISYDGYFIGNAGMFGGTDTGEPFLLYRDRATRLVGVTNQSTGTINITIELQVSGLNLQAKSNINPTTSSQTIQADSGYDGLSSVQINAMPSGTAGTPTATKGSVSNHSISVTPSVTNTTGYITGSTKTGTAVTVSASELVSGSETKTANGTYDVTNLASLVVNVSGGSGIGTLLNTTSIGTVSTTSTQAASLNVSCSVSNINNYDLLIVESSVNTKTNGRHAATVGLIFLTSGSSIGTKDGATVATVKLNTKLSSNGTATSVAGTTAYGIYPNSCSISSGTASIPMYRRYNSTSTGTINGTYTARVYGVNLYDLIGG